MKDFNIDSQFFRPQLEKFTPNFIGVLNILLAELSVLLRIRDGV